MAKACVYLSHQYHCQWKLQWKGFSSDLPATLPRKLTINHAELCKKNPIWQIPRYNRLILASRSSNARFAVKQLHVQNIEMSTKTRFYPMISDNWNFWARTVTKTWTMIMVNTSSIIIAKDIASIHPVHLKNGEKCRAVAIKTRKRRHTRRGQ